VSAAAAEDVQAPARLADHAEYDCPGCRKLAEYPIVADVYGCAAGRHCTVATPDQRFEFEQRIAERIAVLWTSGSEGV